MILGTLLDVGTEGKAPFERGKRQIRSSLSLHVPLRPSVAIKSINYTKLRMHKAAEVIHVLHNALLIERFWK